MHSERAKYINLSCPACGFQIFNRRHPNCERCKLALPDSLLYSEEELRSLLDAGEKQLSRDIQHAVAGRTQRFARRSTATHATSESIPPELPASNNTAGYNGIADSVAEPFASGGGGVFDGGGASDSFSTDSGSSGSTD